MWHDKRLILAGSMILLCGTALTQMGCSGLTPVENVTIGTVATTAVGARSPTHEIEQIYYLGVFDPQEQLPPSVYRVRVHGQASFISFMRFASGWVRADLIDSLGTGIEFEKNGEGIKITKGDESMLSSLKTGRRLVLFGPEGFREAPKDHRLAIVMGSSPENFFKAIDESIGVVSEVMAEQGNTKLSQLLFEALAKIKNERERLSDLKNDIKTDLPEQSEVKL
ncbi:MAG: hypothetical protein F9K48_02770 [Candidatus Brocadia sp.]|nr:MAG: hypothetical protein F9K48_02770 [Candidatus Brocadia sp.]